MIIEIFRWTVVVFPFIALVMMGLVLFVARREKEMSSPKVWVMVTLLLGVGFLTAHVAMNSAYAAGVHMEVQEDVRYLFEGAVSKTGVEGPLLIDERAFRRNAAAIYDPVSRKITVHPDMYEEEDEVVRQIIYHEIGHNIWYERLTGEQRKEWKAMYADTTFFPTGYAKTNVAEDFADSYALFMMGKEYSLDSERVSLLRNIVQ